MGERHGRLMVGEAGELMVEFQDEKAAKALSDALTEHFGDQVLLAP
jgi:23S rRNA A1618 N6-methylase RlmF